MTLKTISNLIIFISIALCSNAQLSGTYTIGGTTPDYTDILSAVNDLQAQGVNGPVNFKIRNGTYHEKIVLSGWTGASATNLVTFESESGDSTDVVWQYWGSSNTTIPLIINGADHINIQKLSIRTTSSGNYRKCVRVLSSVTNLSFKNCSFRGATYANNEDENIVDVYGGYGVIFDRCQFNFGHNAIHIVDSYNGVRNNHSFITNCVFNSFKETGVFAQYFDDITIEDNYFYSDYSYGVTGIEFEDGTGVITVKRNQMDLTITPTGIGDNRAMRCNASTFTAGSIIANNMIHLKGQGTSQGAIQLNSDPAQTCVVDVVYNTIRLQGSGIVNYPTINGGTNGTRILNNILSSTITTDIINSPNADSIDYNILYSDGSVDWTQTLNYIGPNNFSFDPLYMSANDLHVIPSLSSNGANPYPGITTDIDGELRDPLTPDIGADEIASFSEDIMISNILSPSNDASYCGSVDNIQVVLSNIGLSTVTNCDVHLEINGSLISTLNWTGSLATGDSDTLDLGSYPYQSGVSYEFVVYSSLPNGVADQMQLNDTIVQSNFHTGLSGVYTLGGTAPDFASFAALQLALDEGGMCGPVTINVRDGIYYEYLLLDDIVGSSQTNTLTIQGESGDSSLVQLRADYGSGVDYTLRINNMSFVTIRDMRIKNDGAINNKVFRMYKTSDITLESLIIQGYSCSGCSSQTTHGLYISEMDSNLVVDKVQCQTPGMSLLLFGNDNLGSDSKNFSFTNSKISKFAIYDCHDIYMADSKLGGSHSDFEDCGHFVIERNHFYAALAFWYSGSAGASSIFRNNTMDAWENDGFSVTWDWAMYLYGTGNIDIYHNTFKCKDVARSIFFSSAGAEVYNNIFYRDNGAVTTTTIPYTFQTTAINAQSDYNIFWVENEIGGTNPLDYIQSNYGLDSNSIYINPNFSTHPDSLFWPTNPLVDNFCTPAWVPADDHYGTLRGVLSDAGAIEKAFPPNANLGPDTTVCGGIELGWIDLGYDYSWNTGDTTSSIQADTSGMYILTVTNAQGTATDTVNVVVNSSPNLTLADTVWHCYGDSTLLQVNQAGLTFLWSNGDTDSIAVYTGSQSANVEVTNAVGCSVSKQFEIIELDSMYLDITVTDEQCIGQNNGQVSVQAVNADGVVGITWSHTVDTNDTLQNLSPDTYYLSVVDEAGCIVSDSAIVGIGNAYPTITLNDTTYHCFGDPAFLDVYQSGLTYEWSNGATSASIEVLGDQLVDVIATNTHGCTDTAQTLVLSHPEIQYSWTHEDETCVGVHDGSVQVTVSGGSGEVDIAWNLVVSDSIIIEDLSPNDYIFTLTDSVLCQVQDTITIQPGTDLAASISATGLACVNSSVQFTGSSTGTTHDWYVDNTWSTTGVNFSQTFGTAGAYSVKLISTDGSCIDSSEVQISIGGPSASTSTAVTCNSSYTWIDGNTYTASNNTATHTLTNMYGCDSIVTLDLTMNTPSAGTHVVTECESYTWLNGVTYTSSNNTAQWTIPNAQGCDSVITLDLTILESTTGIDVVTGCNSFTWIDGVTYTSDNNTATHVLQNAQGCDSIVTLNLTMNYVITDVTEDAPTLYSSPFVDTYQWVDCNNGYAPIPGETAVQFTATVDGSYAVIVEFNGCVDTSDCYIIDNANLFDLEDLNWTISPNPTKSVVKISFDKSLDAGIEVRDALGRLVSEQEVIDLPEAELALGEEPGVYFVKVVAEGKELVVPVVKL